MIRRPQKVSGWADTVSRVHKGYHLLIAFDVFQRFMTSPHAIRVLVFVKNTREIFNNIFPDLNFPVYNLYSMTRGKSKIFLFYSGSLSEGMIPNLLGRQEECVDWPVKKVQNKYFCISLELRIKTCHNIFSVNSRRKL